MAAVRFWSSAYVMFSPILRGPSLAYFWKGQWQALSASYLDEIQGSLFGPYTPLQQLDTLADHDTRSYVVGSTNSLLLAQKDRYCDVLVNVRVVWLSGAN
jgi:hypothetical protein